MKTTSQAETAGIVLAGAHGWGESVFDSICCRPLLPLVGWPVAGHALYWIEASGIRQQYVCANSDTHAFRRALGHGNGLATRIDYYEDPMPRGPAGCLRDAALATAAEVFVVMEGTVICDLNLTPILEAHRQQRAAVTVVVAEAGSRRGRTYVLQPVGVYVVSRRAIELIPRQGYQDIKEMWLPRLYQHEQRVWPYAVPQQSSVRITGLKSYLAAMGLLLEQLDANYWEAAGYEQSSEVWVHASARIGPGVRFLGPAVIGPGCELGPNVRVIGPSTIGANCRLARGAIVSRSAVWSNCTVPRDGIVDHCVLTHEAPEDPGTVLRDSVWATRNCRPIETSNAYWAMPSRGAHADRFETDAVAVKTSVPAPSLKVPGKPGDPDLALLPVQLPEYILKAGTAARPGSGSNRMNRRA